MENLLPLLQNIPEWISFPPTLSRVSLALVSYMAALWLVSLVVRDASIVDTFWGPGFLLSLAVVFPSTEGDPLRRIFLLGMVSLWGLRLAIHLMLRSRGRGEDFRYAKWRRESGSSWWWKSFFQVFLLQGVVLFLLVLPYAFALQDPAPLSLWNVTGGLLWMTGFLTESVADAQLLSFKRRPGSRGRVMDEGVWRYSRHPNYFGESLLWWGIYLFCLTPMVWWGFYSPLLLTLLLLYVSGVHLLDENLSRRGPHFREYMERTSAFLPWPPRYRKERKGKGELETPRLY